MYSAPRAAVIAGDDGDEVDALGNNDKAAGVAVDIDEEASIPRDDYNTANAEIIVGPDANV